jgi:NTE family protein
MCNYRVGDVKNPTVSLVAAVTALSTFPPVLSPILMELDFSSFTPAGKSEKDPGGQWKVRGYVS